MAWFSVLGDSNSLSWLNNYSTWLNYVISNYGGYNLYSEYDIAVEVDSSGDALFPITSLSQYTITAGTMTSLSWSASNPAFTVNGPDFGYVVTAGDKWIFGPDQASIPQTTGAVNLSYYTPYYTRDVSGNSFNLATSPGGPAIPITNSGTLIQPNGQTKGASTPGLLMAAPPSASSGLFPQNAQGQNDSYLLYRFLSWNWAVCAGASGYSTPLTDATTRLNVNFPDFTSDALWYGQNSL